MTPKQLEKWAETRVKGKTHYIWFQGVLKWGGVMFVFMTLFMLSQQPAIEGVSRQVIPIAIVIINALVWPVAGYIYGVLNWSSSEKLFKKVHGVDE